MTSVTVEEMEQAVGAVLNPECKVLRCGPGGLFLMIIVTGGAGFIGSNLGPRADAHGITDILVGGQPGNCQEVGT